jgi:hypothetical protein
VLKGSALNGLGLAKYYLGDYDGSRVALAEAHRVFPESPYPVTNLARVAARQKRFDEMQDMVERAIPLIDPQDQYLIERLATEESFGDHLGDVLTLLHTHHRLSPREFTEKFSAWKRGTLQLATRNFNIANFQPGASVGAFTMGSNSPVSDVTIDGS